MQDCMTKKKGENAKFLHYRPCIYRLYIEIMIMKKGGGCLLEYGCLNKWICYVDLPVLFHVRSSAFLMTKYLTVATLSWNKTKYSHLQLWKSICTVFSCKQAQHLFVWDLVKTGMSLYVNVNWHKIKFHNNDSWPENEGMLQHKAEPISERLHYSYKIQSRQTKMYA